jgi:hypothetical protein
LVLNRPDIKTCGHFVHSENTHSFVPVFVEDAQFQTAYMVTARKVLSGYLANTRSAVYLKIYTIPHCL